MKLHEALSSRRQAVPCGHKDGWTDRQTDRQTAMNKPLVAFRNFAKSPKFIRSVHTVCFEWI